MSFCYVFNCEKCDLTRPNS